MKLIGTFAVRLAVGALIAGTAHSQTPPPTFRARTDYSAYPLNVVIADVNNDGIVDMVVDGPEVWLGNGDGTFREVQQPAANLGRTPQLDLGTTSATLLAVADVDGDGKPDIVFAPPFANDVYVILGFGDGTFQNPDTQAAVYPAPGPLYSLAVADLNHDGHPDIVAAGDGVTILTNEGNGIFSATAQYLTGQQVDAVSIRDINGDRQQDIAVGLSNSTIQFLLGTVSGSFQSGATLTSPTLPGSIAFADFNNDGFVDLAVGGSFWAGASAQVTIFPGQGGGSFGSPLTPITYSTVGQIAIGDVNHDGHPDIVVLENNPDVVGIYINSGSFTFKPPVHYSAAAGASDLAVAPLRTPGLPDIVVAGNLGYAVSVLLNQGNGTYQDGWHLPLPTQPGQMITADFNRDGFGDLAAITTSGVQIFPATGNSATPFSTGTLIALPATSIAAGDFNDDGRPDLAIALTNNQIAIVFGKGNGAFTAPVYTSPGGVSSNEPLLLWAGDFNGDGKTDLATSFNSCLLGNGKGTFQAPFPIMNQQLITKYGSITAIGTGDLNGDGIGDMIVSTGPSDANLFPVLGSASGALTTVGQYVSNQTLNQIIIADVNGDRIPDAIGVPRYEGSVIFFGIGGGAFQQSPVTLSAISIGTFGGAVADFNGDGIADIAISTNGDSSIALYVGTGGGTFAAPVFLGTAPGATWVVSGHFHGSQTQFPDLAVPSIDGIDVLLNTTR